MVPRWCCWWRCWCCRPRAWHSPRHRPTGQTHGAAGTSMKTPSRTRRLVRRCLRPRPRSLRRSLRRPSLPRSSSSSACRSRSRRPARSPSCGRAKPMCAATWNSRPRWWRGRRPFADMAQRVAWSTPESRSDAAGAPGQRQGHRGVRPAADVAAQRVDQVRWAATMSCSSSSAATARTATPSRRRLQAFQARHGIQVVAISIDGGPLPGFADARRDNGIATTLKVNQVPGGLPGRSPSPARSRRSVSACCPKRSCSSGSPLPPPPHRSARGHARSPACLAVIRTGACR